MSGPEAERKALTPYAASYPMQVQTAGRQLALAAQLNRDLERRRLVAILKRMSSNDAVAYLSTSQALDADLIDRFADRWEWGGLGEGLSLNTTLPWSIELVERFKEHEWCWGELSSNVALPWSLELIEHFVDFWDWGGLSRNGAVPWSTVLIERFADRWKWDSLSLNSALPWSADLIERYQSRVVF